MYQETSSSASDLFVDDSCIQQVCDGSYNQQQAISFDDSNYSDHEQQSGVNNEYMGAMLDSIEYRIDTSDSSSYTCLQLNGHNVEQNDHTKNQLILTVILFALEFKRKRNFMSAFYRSQCKTLFHCLRRAYSLRFVHRLNKFFFTEKSENTEGRQRFIANDMQQVSSCTCTVMHEECTAVV